MKQRKIQGEKGEIPQDIKELQSLFHIVERGKMTWEATFDAIQDPVLVLSGDYQIERANISASETASLPITHMIGKKCYEVFAGRKAICPHCPLEATVAEKRPHTVEIEKLRKGSDFLVSSYPLMIGEAREKKAVHHYRDVTGQKRLQRQLIQSEKLAAIGMLAGGVAHEINNPLGGILAFTQLLQSDLPKESPAQSDLKEIEEAARRCKKIVSDLLFFSRPGIGLEAEPQDVNSLLEKVLPLLKLNLRSSSVEIQTHYGKDLPEIFGEPTRLQQVFLNLVQNAAEAMKGGGAVTVRTCTSPDGTELFIEVQDQGPGISPEILSKVFDPFFTTKGVRGTGLGLAICDSIIHDHRGRIEVESTLGKGSLFRVVLPISKEAV